MNHLHRTLGLTIAASMLIVATTQILQAQGVGTRPILTPAPVPATPQATLPAAGQAATPAQPGAAAAAAGQPSDDAAPISASYKIGPADALTVTVWKEANLSGPYEVRPDGKIAMPLLGDLEAAGMTPMALSDSITQKLKKYVQDPLVTVNVTSVNSKRIYLLGEVGHVGPMALTAGLSPMQAIATAGGLGAFANAKKIYILRTVDGKEEKIPFNYKKAIKNGDQQGIVLKPGDTIVVP